MSRPCGYGFSSQGRNGIRSETTLIRRECLRIGRGQRYILIAGTVVARHPDMMISRISVSARTRTTSTFSFFFCSSKPAEPQRWWQVIQGTAEWSRVPYALPAHKPFMNNSLVRAGQPDWLFSRRFTYYTGGTHGSTLATGRGWPRCRHRSSTFLQA